MSVSAITFGKGFQGSGGSAMQQLEKQLKDLNTQIRKELASQDDAKTKDAKLKTLEAELTVVELRISQEKEKQAKSASGQSQNNGQQSASSQTSQTIQSALNSIDLVG